MRSADIEFRSFDSSHRNGVHDAVQIRIFFGNGWGASAVCSPLTYGGPEGLWELAVLGPDGIRYDSGLTADVKGWLTPEQVTRWFDAVSSLPNVGPYVAPRAL